jgi:hypothetical protein
MLTLLIASTPFFLFPSNAGGGTPLLVDIVCTALCDISDIFRRVLLGTALV